MAQSRIKTKGRRESGPFLAVPRQIIDSSQYRALNAYGIKLLFDLWAQYRGNNNGDLCAAWTLMQPLGWRSKGTLHKAIRELRDAGWILLARQGGRHKASLYALSFLPIDECSGKLDIPATNKPPGTWKQIKNGTRYAGHIGTPPVPIEGVDDAA